MEKQNRLKILFMGVENDASQSLESYLRGQISFQIRSSYSNKAGALLWPNLEDRNSPDIIILNIDDHWEKMLSTVPNSAHSHGKVLVVIGPEGNSHAMRMAMKMGARDYFSPPIAVEEVTEALKQIGDKFVHTANEKQKQIISIINSKGGSGGSFISTNLAHLFASSEKLNTALLDFDFQFGVQSLSLDLTIEHSLESVLDMAQHLDSVSLKGYLSKHSSGIHLLAEQHDNIVLSGDLDATKVSRLLNLIEQGFDQTIVDLPRQVDAVFSTVVTQSHHIFLVMQQSVAHVRDTRRLLRILVEELEVPSDRIRIIVNRYDANNSIDVKAIEKTVAHSDIYTLCNDYKRVITSINMATLLYEHAPNAPLTKELISLCHQLRGVFTEDKTTLLNKMFGNLLGL